MQRTLRSLAALAVAACALASAAFSNAVATVQTKAADFGAAVSHATERAGKLAYFHGASFAYDVRAMLGAALFAGMTRAGLILRAFPGSVTSDLAFGIVGELAFDGPFRAQPARIDHGTAANIVVGRWFTLAADGTARPGGAGALAGILMNPKNYSNAGAGGNALAPSMTLPTGTVGEFGYMGAFVVAAPAAVALGNAAKYDTTTGVIGVGAPGAGEAAIPNSRFIRVANAAAGLCVLELTN